MTRSRAPKLAGNGSFALPRSLGMWVRGRSAAYIAAPLLLALSTGCGEDKPPVEGPGEELPSATFPFPELAARRHLEVAKGPLPLPVPESQQTDGTKQELLLDSMPIDFMPVTANGLTVHFSVDAVRVAVWDENYYDGTDGQANCPNEPVSWSMYYANPDAPNGTEAHGSCYTNIADSTDAGKGICNSKFPMLNRPIKHLRMRRWNIGADCVQNHQAGYTDFEFPQGYKIRDGYLYRTTATTAIESETWKAVLDRNSGTLFEFYNKRAPDPNLPAGTYESAVAADMGAAAQNAFFGSGFNWLTNEPCGGQGIWNPTQAGAICTCTTPPCQGNSYTTVPSGPGAWNLPLYCDGVRNDTCATASSNIVHGFFNLYNWDYGAAPGRDGKNGYVWGRNPQDTMQLQQQVTKFNDYMRVDVAFRNRAPDLDLAAQVPAFFLTEKFRSYYHPLLTSSGAACPLSDCQDVLTEAGTKICHRSVSRAARSEDGYEYMEQSIGAQADWYCPNMVQPDWITFENTDPESAESYYVTIAVMYGSAMNEDNLGYKWAVLDTRNAFHNTAWFNAPAQRVRENVEYRYRWVVFPYKYSDVLPGTRTTVAQKIAQLRTGYTPTSDLEKPVGFVDQVTRDAHVEGWAVDPDITDPIRVHVFIDGESVGFPWASDPRSDVNEGNAYPGDHGFSWPIPAVYRDGGTHTVRAAGIDSSSAAETELGGTPMTFCFDGDAECHEQAH